jgi:hypothetical protein
MQGPTKGAMLGGDQMHTVGYAGSVGYGGGYPAAGYNCVGCGGGQPVAYGGGYNAAYGGGCGGGRRGLFHHHRRRGCGC